MDQAEELTESMEVPPSPGPFGDRTDEAWDKYLGTLAVQEANTKQTFQQTRGGDAVKASKPSAKASKKGGREDKELKKSLQLERNSMQHRIFELETEVKRSEVELEEKEKLLQSVKTQLIDTKAAQVDLERKLEKKEKVSKYMIEEQHDEMEAELSELRHENKIMKLTLQGMDESMKLFDPREVEEHNHQLRMMVGQLHRDKVENDAKMAKQAAEWRKSASTTRYKLEREFRQQLSTAEGRIREQVMSRLEEDSRNAVMQRDELTDFLYHMVDSLDVVTARVREIESENNQLAIDTEVTDDLTFEQARIMLNMRTRLKEYETANNDLTRRLSIAESRINAPELPSTSMLSEEDAQRLQEQYDTMRAQMVRWKDRSNKLEQSNINLRKHLKKTGEPPTVDDMVSLTDSMDYKSIWSSRFTNASVPQPPPQAPASPRTSSHITSRSSQIIPSPRLMLGGRSSFSGYSSTSASSSALTSPHHSQQDLPMTIDNNNNNNNNNKQPGGDEPRSRPQSAKASSSSSKSTTKSKTLFKVLPARGMSVFQANPNPRPQSAHPSQRPYNIGSRGHPIAGSQQPPRPQSAHHINKKSQMREDPVWKNVMPPQMNYRQRKASGIAMGQDNSRDAQLFCG